MRRYPEPRLLIRSLFAITILLAACQGTQSASNPTSESRDGPGVANLPSISELAGSPSPEVLPLPTLSPDEVALGREVYQEHCAECHGDKLEGEESWQMQNEDGSFRSPPHDATGHTWHHGDRVLLESIELGGARLPDNIGGASNMPAFEETLTGKEISAVLIFVKSTWPEDIRRIQWEQSLRENN